MRINHVQWRPLDNADQRRKTTSTDACSCYGMWRNRDVDNTQLSMRDRLRKEAGDQDGLTWTMAA